MHVGSSQGEKCCIWDNLCKFLPAALVSADSTSVNTIPCPNHCCQHLPCQSWCHISCPSSDQLPRHCPYTPNSCFSQLAEQSSRWALSRHCPIMYSYSSVGTQPKLWQRSGELQSAPSLIISLPWPLIQKECQGHQNGWITSPGNLSITLEQF